jgi:predicted RNase H-like nuclease
MPQMSSTDRILIDAQDMTDALKHPHPDVPFATIGDNTIAALEKLSEIFTRKLKKQEKPDPIPEPERLHGTQ